MSNVSEEWEHMGTVFMTLQNPTKGVNPTEFNQRRSGTLIQNQAHTRFNRPLAVSALFTGVYGVLSSLCSNFFNYLR